MEKAIIKTLAYADIFDYPLKAWEIHKWLIGPPAGRAGRKATLRQIERALERLIKKRKINAKKGYYFFYRRDSLIAKRLRKQEQATRYLRKARFLVQVLKLIPWIKLVGISGGLAMDNAGVLDDIDLFIITANRRVWITRFLTLGLLSLTGQRRNVTDSGRKIAGKLCINILLEEDRLAQAKKDIFVAHEVLQMKVLWQRDGIYSRFLEDNNWAFKFLPNWIGHEKVSKVGKVPKVSKGKSFNILEKLAKWFQLKIMNKPQGLERIEDGALYFHPEDCGPKIVSEYKRRLVKISRA